MFEDYKICPYTGLRPFTEDESIYFKGRDEHIEQATLQLEKNKFIMLTGASGDGKSSLVYAGIVPNAKAGFLKASFSNWAVVDFRPERTPMANLCQAVASQLGINAGTVATELNYGFSALVDIYKASSLYYDTKSAEWLEGDESKKNERRRQAANLIILADQFEEFFTNPENFERGVPSQEAMSVTNLLLETARIALEEKLPIFVVITMRSDFIGQCAAFRGLPEYIGFSQFFVPRLNRKQLQEVIEEPAILSGNTIERRLTERLIHDIVEGTDQLPILQHALNQIWKMADEGAVTMDLLQYAMVGGMRGADLEPAEAARFKTWFSGLAPSVQECYTDPSLQNVLNTHANKLYNEDADQLAEKRNRTVSDGDAKLVIKTAFKCLTKIDNGRAVRNRMTLKEITDVLNVPHLDVLVVGQILDIFRDSGNTLLRPFAEEVPVLREDDVLDITHESLIRNWRRLAEWALEEYNSYNISRDFGQQLNRWLENNKSGDFLLSMGPLTYFEEWVRDEKPNAAWLARYLKGEQSKEAKLAKARTIQADANEYLRRSGGKHAITRTVVRYGAGRIALVAGLIALITLSSFVAVDFWRQRNAYVLNKIKGIALSTAGDTKVALFSRTIMLGEGLFSGIITIPEVIDAVSDSIRRIDVSTGVATQLVYQGTREPRREILQSLKASDSLLSRFPITVANSRHTSAVIKEINDLSDITELAYFYNPSPEIQEIRSSNSRRAAQWALAVISNQPASFNDIANLNRALEIAMNQKSLATDEVKLLIAQLSPFGDSSVSKWEQEQFSPDRICEKGFFRSGFHHNGLYQELAYLYGVEGDAAMALRCMDSLLKYNEHYTLKNYTLSPDNAAHIAASFYQGGHEEALDRFVAGYCSKTQVSESEFYARLLARCKLYEFSTTSTENLLLYDNAFNLSLEYSSHEQIDFFFRKYRQVLDRTEKNKNQHDFLTAISYKDQGIIHLRMLEVAVQDSSKVRYHTLFDKAIDLYRSVDKDFLNESIDVVELQAGDNITVARKFLFLYPDIRTPFHPNEPLLYHFAFTTGAFIEYVMTKELFHDLYNDPSSLRSIEVFLRDYHYVETDIVYTASKRLSYRLLAMLEKNLSETSNIGNLNIDFLYLYAGAAAAKAGEGEKVRYYYSKCSADKLKSFFINSFNTGFPMTLDAQAVADLTRFEYYEDAYRIASIFQSSVNRSSIYAYAAQRLLFDNINDTRTDRLIDSAVMHMKREVNLSARETNRLQVALALSLRNGPGDVAVATRTIKNIELKNVAHSYLSRAAGFRSNLNEAAGFIMDDRSVGDNNFVIINILAGYNQQPERPVDEHWASYVENRDWINFRPIGYSDENN